MKLFIAAVLFFFTPYASWACMPRSVSECKTQELIEFNFSDAVALSKEADPYERLLSRHMKVPEFRDSCFGVFDVSYELSRLRDSMKKHPGRACPRHIKLFVGSILGMINPKSQELKTVTSPDIKEQLAVLSASISEKAATFRTTYKL